MIRTTHCALALAALAGLAAFTEPAAAHDRSDDKADHVHQCRGCGDPPDHVRRHRGGDEVAAEDGGRGRGQGQGQGRGRGGDDATEDAAGKGQGQGQGRGRAGDDDPGQI